MKSCLLAALIILTVILPKSSYSQRSYPPSIEGAKELIYKTVGQTDLKLWIFGPAADGKPRPAIVFFFGGGWKAGSPEQFVPQSEYLAERGMLAIVADYRVAKRHGTLAKDCVEDARAAMQYVRRNASLLGIDPERIGAGGGSAGGHIAACLGVIEADKESKPDCLVLFNPACVLAPLDGKSYWKEDRSSEMRERMGVDPVSLSPAHHVNSSAPPCIIFHGEADPVVPFATARVFSQKMKNAGVRCDLKGYAGEGHGFFNQGKDNGAFTKTMQQLDAFLVELGWLPKK